MNYRLLIRDILNDCFGNGELNEKSFIIIFCGWILGIAISPIRFLRPLAFNNMEYKELIKD